MKSNILLTLQGLNSACEHAIVGHSHDTTSEEKDNVNSGYALQRKTSTCWFHFTLIFWILLIQHKYRFLYAIEGNEL